MKFSEFKLSDSIVEAVKCMGFETATPIQEKSIPITLTGKDLIAVAQTGTGKTAAFVLPILNSIVQNKKKGIKALIITPTRELAIQIDRQIQGFSYFLDIASIAVYGGGAGDDFEKEKQAFVNKTEIIVATPGKLMTHMRMGYVDFNMLDHLVLDEADRMLDMGFFEDISFIISKLPQKRQTLLFSATMPEQIRVLASKIQNKPEKINIAGSKPAKGVLQGVYKIEDEKKIGLIKSLISKNPEYTGIIVFCSTKKAVSKIVNSLKSNKYEVKGMSSDYEQAEREEVMRLFKAKKIRIVVATDVISRGIDIQDISLIINYDVPSDAEDYVHRVGRTARAEKEGVAITLVNKYDYPKLQQIEKLIGYQIKLLITPDEFISKENTENTNQKKPGIKPNQRRKKRFFKPKNKQPEV